MREEIVYVGPNPKIYLKGTFVYRLAGRDRQAQGPKNVLDDARPKGVAGLKELVGPTPIPVCSTASLAAEAVRSWVLRAKA